MGAWEELDTTIEVDLDLTDLDQLISMDDPVFEPLKDIAKDVKNAIENGSKRGALELAKTNVSFQEKYINDNCKNPSGILASSIGYSGSAYSYTTGTRINHIYPMSVEYGADIYPIRAKALKFPAPDDWDGDVDEDGFVYLKEAHPKPHPFVAPAYEDTDEISEDLIIREIGHAGINWN